MAMIHRFKFQNCVLIKWVISYLLILIIPIMLGSIIMGNIHSLLIHEYEMMNVAVQQEISQRLEEYFDKIINLNILISRNTDINTFIQKPAATAQKSRADLIKIAKQFQSYHYFSEISTSYLYVHNTDSIISTQSLIDRSLFKNERFAEEPLYHVDLESFIHNYNSNSIELLEMPNGQSPHLMLVKSLPSDAYRHPQATLFQIFTEDALQNLLRNVSSSSFSHILLLDDNGEIISGNAPDDLTILPESKFMTAQSGQMECMLSGQKYLIFYSQIPALKGVRCAMTISFQDIQKKIEPLQQKNFLFIALSIGLGSLLAFFLLQQNYRPVQRILREITPYSGNSSHDAFEQISHTFQSVVSANQEWNRIWKHQEQFLQERFLESLFTGNVADTPVTREILSSFSITFHGNFFCVLLFSAADGTPETGEMLFAQFQESFFNHLSNGMMYSTQIDGVRTVLINIDEAPETYKNLCEETRLFAENRHFFWVLSRLCSSLNTVNICYQEAVDYFRRKQQTYQKEGWFSTEPTFQRTELEDFGIAFQLEEEFLQQIYLGNADHALKCFQNEKEKKCRNGIRSLSYQSFAYGITNIIWKAVKQLPNLEKKQFEKLTNHTNAFLTSENLIEAEEHMAVLLNLLCKAYQSNPEKEAEQPFIQDIILCVENHFSETSFNATKLAEYLDKNLSYLSKTFKNTTGVGLHDYISRVRINQGKKLLSQKRLSITEVAHQVGFENLNSFIRVFKKFESVTPGSYHPEGPDSNSPSI